MLIVVSGFALFLLSDFPPTQRLGVLVCIGAALTDIVVLLRERAVSEKVGSLLDTLDENQAGGMPCQRPRRRVVVSRWHMREHERIENAQALGHRERATGGRPHRRRSDTIAHRTKCVIAVPTVDRSLAKASAFSATSRLLRLPPVI